MAGKPKAKTEQQEQSTLINWFRNNYPDELLFAIPNGGSRHPLEAFALKRSGVVAGIPDLMLASARGASHGLFIEMKRTKGGVMSESQKDMATLLQSKGYLAIVCFGAEDAKLHIQGYMQDMPWTAQ